MLLGSILLALAWTALQGEVTLVNLLEANRGNFVINRKALTEVYVRRGLKRIPGVRDKETGKVSEADESWAKRWEKISK